MGHGLEASACGPRTESPKQQGNLADPVLLRYLKKACSFQNRCSLSPLALRQNVKNLCMVLPSGSFATTDLDLKSMKEAPRPQILVLIGHGTGVPSWISMDFKDLHYFEAWSWYLRLRFSPAASESASGPIPCTEPFGSRTALDVLFVTFLAPSLTSPGFGGLEASFKFQGRLGAKAEPRRGKCNVA